MQQEDTSRMQPFIENSGIKQFLQNSRTKKTRHGQFQGIIVTIGTEFGGKQYVLQEEDALQEALL